MEVDIVEERIGVRNYTSGEEWGIPRYRIKPEDEQNEERQPQSSDSGQPLQEDDSSESERGQTSSQSEVEVPEDENENTQDTSDEDEDCVLEAVVPIRAQSPSEVVEVDVGSDSGSDEGQAPVQQRYQLRTRRPATRPILDGSSDSSEDETTDFEPRTKREKIIHRISDPAQLIKKFDRNPDRLDDYRKCIIESTNDRTAMLEFCKKYGGQLEDVELINWSWNPLNREIETEDSEGSINLPTFLIHTKCIHTLTLGPPPAPDFLKDGANPNFKFKKLKSFNYDARSSGRLNTASQGKLENILRIIFKESENLQTFQCKVRDRVDLDHVLRALTSACIENCHLRQLHTLNLASIEDRPVNLEESEIEILGKLKLRLRHLVLGFGLWENILKTTFFKMLSNYPRLEELVIQGTFQGELNSGKPPLTIDFPLLSQLRKLSTGGEYTFSSPIENPTGSPRKVVSIEKEFGLLKVQFKLPMLPNLEELRLGSLSYIDNLRAQNFPKLKSLRIGGPWNLSFDFLKEDILFPTVTELQFPDGLKDPSFSTRVPKLFPNLKKAWLFLPSAAVLRAFIQSFKNGGPLLEELHLKIQFYFVSTFESCLLGRGITVGADTMEYERKLMKALNKYKFKEDFVEFHNIEFLEDEPPAEGSDEAYPGLGVFESLKVLTLEHVPRVVRIPQGEYRWYDPRCEFSGRVLGFEKFPLSRDCLRQLPVEQLKSCQWPNFQVSQRDLNMFEKIGFSLKTGGVLKENKVAYNGPARSRSDSQDSSDNSRRRTNTGPPKVRVEPSQLRFAPFKPKFE